MMTSVNFYIVLPIIFSACISAATHRASNLSPPYLLEIDVTEFQAGGGVSDRRQYGLALSPGRFFVCVRASLAAREKKIPAVIINISMVNHINEAGLAWWHYVYCLSANECASRVKKPASNTLFVYQSGKAGSAMCVRKRRPLERDITALINKLSYNRHLIYIVKHLTGGKCSINISRALRRRENKYRRLGVKIRNEALAAPIAFDNWQRQRERLVNVKFAATRLK